MNVSKMVRRMFLDLIDRHIVALFESCSSLPVLRLGCTSDYVFVPLAVLLILWKFILILSIGNSFSYFPLAIFKLRATSI